MRRGSGASAFTSSVPAVERAYSAEDDEVGGAGEADHVVGARQREQGADSPSAAPRRGRRSRADADRRDHARRAALAHAAARDALRQIRARRQVEEGPAPTNSRSECESGIGVA